MFALRAACVTQYENLGASCLGLYLVSTRASFLNEDFALGARNSRPSKPIKRYIKLSFHRIVEILENIKISIFAIMLARRQRETNQSV